MAMAISSSRGRVATVGIKEIAFHVPVAIGDEVSCYSELIRAGNTSITTRIEVWARRRNAELQVKVTEGIFTFVAIDDDGRPRPISAGGDRER